MVAASLDTIHGSLPGIENVIFFNPFPKKPLFLHDCSTSLLKTQSQKEKLLVMSNFSISDSVFYPCVQLVHNFLKSKIVVYKLFQFVRV